MWWMFLGFVVEFRGGMRAEVMRAMRAAPVGVRGQSWEVSQNLTVAPEITNPCNSANWCHIVNLYNYEQI